MIEDFDLDELFAEFDLEDIEAGAEKSDPGPDGYDESREAEKRKLMQQMAFYAEEGETWDPKGKYLCGTCYYRQLMDWGDTPACYIVDGKISMETGSCAYYKHGNPDSESNPLPAKHKYSQTEAMYAERPKEKGFGCYPRCEYGTVAEGKDKDGREIWCKQFGVHVRPKACCAFEDGKDLVQIDAGGPGSGCNPEVGKCGRPEGPQKDEASFYMKEKIGGPQGTNPGGMYRGQDGEYRYVKLYSNPKQARGEYLANKLYNQLGVPAPKSILFKKDGGDVIASNQLEGKTIQQMGTIDRAQARQFMNGFAADVLTANWDAVGTGMDNIFVAGDGKLYRLDQGGTFLTRAKGADKPESLLNGIMEASNFFNKGVNSYYANVAATAGVKSVADLGPQTGTNAFKLQVQSLMDLRDTYGSWKDYVKLSVPDMPEKEQQKIATMLEARTNLMQSLMYDMPKPSPTVLKPEDEEVKKDIADTAKKETKARDWSTSNPNLVGGYFRNGTVLASVYTTLSAKPGEWQSISKIKADLETKLGKPLYNISQNTLKQGGKKSGLWQVEVSGDSIRMYVTKPGEKTTTLDVTDDKQSFAANFAKQMFQKMPPMGYGSDNQANVFTAYFKAMGVPLESQKSLEKAIDDWTGTNHSNSSQNWRQVAMQFYGRTPEGEYTDSYKKVIGTPEGDTRAKKMEPAAMAMKAYASEFAKLSNVSVVYRNIAGDQAKKIVADMREAAKQGLTKIPISNNSLSCWSDKPGLSLSDTIKIRMKVDPDNVWAAHNATPYLFTAHPHEREWMIGTHNPVEIFDFKDISIEDTWGSGATKEEYAKWHKEFKMTASAEKDNLDPQSDKAWYEYMQKLYAEKGKSLFGKERTDVYWGGQILAPDDHWMYKKK